MFLVRQQGKVIGSFDLFVDAWLYVYLECECFAHILERGTSEVWVINPAYRTSHPIN